nr:diaminopimelate epimerase [Legionella sp. km772]
MKFTKMHGLGNDFMVIDGVNQHIDLHKEQIIRLSNRYTGVGFDQCLLIEPSCSAEVDFSYRIFNADGREVGQCGNGARCLALFAQRYGLTKQKTITVATKTTTMRLTINNNESVRVNMGTPKLNPKELPFNMGQQQTRYELPLKNGRTVSLHAISVGNPHAVLLVDDINQARVQELGEEITAHAYFPEQTNVGFMQILNQEHIKLRVYERGCGETNACGSGAVAAAAIGKLYYGLAESIKVSLLGGDLIIDWTDRNSAIYLTGPACFVYEGELV